MEPDDAFGDESPQQVTSFGLTTVDAVFECERTGTDEWVGRVWVQRTSRSFRWDCHGV